MRLRAFALFSDMTSKEILNGLSEAQWAAYERFAMQSQRKFRIIASKTMGEHSSKDVEGDAIFVALELRERHGHEIDFDKPEFRSVLFQHLYQRIVRWTDTNVRYAARLEQTFDGEEGAGTALAERLASDESFDPLNQIMRKESLVEMAAIEDHPSLAAAYVRLLDHCNYRMVSMATHLLLSISHTYRRLALAKDLAVRQHPLGIVMPSKDFVPGPWRSFRLKRPHLQLSFDFDEQAGLAA